MEEPEQKWPAMKTTPAPPSCWPQHRLFGVAGIIFYQQFYFLAEHTAFGINIVDGHLRTVLSTVCQKLACLPVIGPAVAIDMSALARLEKAANRTRDNRVARDLFMDLRSPVWIKVFLCV